MSSNSHDALVAANYEQLQSGRFSDFTVICGQRTWRLHQMIVCPRSEYFDRALNGGFQEGTTQTVTLEDDDPEIVNKMISYLYTSNYDKDITAPHLQEHEISPNNNSTEKTITYEQMIIHVRVYSLAEKYIIEGLTTLATSKFQAVIGTRWPLPQFPAIVREIFTSTPPTDKELRDVAVKKCARYVGDLLKKEETVAKINDKAENQLDLPEHDTWKQVMDDIGAFSTRVLVSVVKKSPTIASSFTQNVLKQKLGPAGLELSGIIDIANRSPRCCRGASFKFYMSGGTGRTRGPRLGLKCTKCQHVYKDLGD